MPVESWAASPGEDRRGVAAASGNILSPVGAIQQIGHSSVYRHDLGVDVAEVNADPAPISLRSGKRS